MNLAQQHFGSQDATLAFRQSTRRRGGDHKVQLRCLKNEPSDELPAGTYSSYLLSHDLSADDHVGERPTRLDVHFQIPPIEKNPRPSTLQRRKKLQQLGKRKVRSAAWFSWDMRSPKSCGTSGFLAQPITGSCEIGRAGVSEAESSEQRTINCEVTCCLRC